MVLPGKQPGLLVAVILPALLSTVVVIARFTRKLKRRPSYISKAGALSAEILMVASVVCLPSAPCVCLDTGLTCIPDLGLDLWSFCDHFDDPWLWHTPG